MSFLSFIGHMAGAKYQDLTARRAATTRTTAPLRLGQGAAVDVDPTPRVLLEAAGGVMPHFEHSQVVVSVGRLKMYGHDVYRSYLSDGRSFIQTVADPSDPSASLETRFYTTIMERAPASQEDWDFLLAEADGYVGYPVFEFPDAAGNQVRYARLWAPGDTRIAPEKAAEILTEADGSATSIQHQHMQYGRALGQGAGATAEYLITSVVRTADGATFDLFLGMDLAKGDLRVYAA